MSIVKEFRVSFDTQGAGQLGMFSEGESEVVPLSASTRSDVPVSDVPVSRSEKEQESVINFTEIPSENLKEKEISAEERTLTVDHICPQCSSAVKAEESVLYEGREFHRSCLEERLKTNDLKKNPKISFSLDLRASDIVRMLDVLELDESLKSVHDKLADVLCQHNNWYGRCTFCGKVVDKSHAIVGGEKTKGVKEETGIVVGIPSGKFFSVVRSTELFCSPVCDLNYSKKLKASWEAEKEAKKAARSTYVDRDFDGNVIEHGYGHGQGSAKGKEKKEKGEDTLSRLFKMAKKSSDVAASLQEIFKSLGVDIKAGGESVEEVHVSGERG
jgi:hypothetical protein